MELNVNIPEKDLEALMVYITQISTVAKQKCLYIVWCITRVGGQYGKLERIDDKLENL